LGNLKKGGARMFPKSIIIDSPFLNYEDLSMNIPLKGVLLGVLAGLIDIIPMIHLLGGSRICHRNIEPEPQGSSQGLGNFLYTHDTYGTAHWFERAA
jgi:hypothetical protein